MRRGSKARLAASYLLIEMVDEDVSAAPLCGQHPFARNEARCLAPAFESAFEIHRHIDCSRVQPCKQCGSFQMMCWGCVYRVFCLMTAYKIARPVYRYYL